MQRGAGVGHDDFADVEAFNAADPFRKADLWERVTITGFIRRQG